MSYDFGTIEQGEKVTHVFKFTNTGQVPLVISNATGSCGCTVPYFPKEPIAPGQTSEIEVEFDSKSRMGLQRKKVYLYANTSPETTILMVKGEVIPRPETEMYAKTVAANEEDRATVENLNAECMILYPNPATDQIQLKLREHIGRTALIKIHDAQGKLLIEKPIQQISHESTQVDVSSFAPGIYMASIFVEVENKYFTQCFVVK